MNNHSVSDRPVKRITDTILDIYDYCQSENFKGYGLYDSHTGVIPFEKFGTYPSFFINQIVKRSPVNFRPLIGVRKGINPKGYGLFLNAYSKLGSIGGVIEEDELRNLNKFFYDWLVKNSSKGYSGYCWGYNYYWPRKAGKSRPAFTPSGVVTGFIVRALATYYKVYKDESVKNVINSASKFVLNDLIHTETEKGLCISYTPIERGLNINANLLAAEILAYDDYLNDKTEHRDILKGVLDFTVNLQNDDGSWYYSHDLESLKPKKQIDFHQGYVLESMANILDHSNIETATCDVSIKKGLEFYYKHQFSEEGYSYWRWPKKWPVDIHNQSQGIITFSRFAKIDSKYLPLAIKIADWTIQNMRNQAGYFYYQKWPVITNKIPYMRWNQGWMTVALVDLLSELQLHSRK